MEASDTRGAGGRAQRSRGTGSTPGRLFGKIVSSPIQLISKTVKGIVGNDRPSSKGAAAAPSPPSQPLQKVSPAGKQLHAPKVDDGPASFSFPTLAGSEDSPPASVLLRPAAAVPSSQARPVENDTSAYAPRTAASPASTGAPSPISKELHNGWSPSKLASLNFFLNGSSQFKLGQGAPESTRPPVPAVLPSFGGGPKAEIFRPYQGLKALLRSGPGGILSGASTSGEADSDGTGLSASAQAPGGGLSHGPTGRPPVGPSSRYNPYVRPNMGKPPRPGINGGAAKPTQATLPPTGASAQQSTAGSLPPAAEQPASLAVAAAQLPPLGPRAHPQPSKAPPRPPTGAGGVKLAPGQVAFASGRTGTPLPKFGPVPGAAQQPGGQTPGGFRPLMGAVGVKRQRDSPAASPLMASGIRNLSEFKRRRQALPQQPRSVLAGLSARTPSGTAPVDRTPGGVAGGRTPDGAVSAVTTPAPATGGFPGPADVPATETARKILETLENFSRAADQAANSGLPHGTGVKSGAQPGPRSGAPSVSPMPGPFLPPLERLDQNHYGGTPTPAVTPSLTMGGAGFVSGTTPIAGQTPGPRMALDFQSPASTPAPQARQAAVSETSQGVMSTPLPLSPIAVPPAPTASDRFTTGNSFEATTSLAAAAAVRPSAAAAEPDTRPAASSLGTGVAAAWESDRGTAEQGTEAAVPSFSFRSTAAPVDPRLRAVNDLTFKAGAAVASISSADVPTFRFSAPSVGLQGPAAAADQATAAAAPSGAQPPRQARAENASYQECLKAAAVPLPDDDDDDECMGAAPEPATQLAAVQPPAAGTRPPMQPFKPVLPAGSKRVGFAELPTAEKAADGPAKETEKASAAAMSPGFFVANAGVTPFRPSAAAFTPDSTEKATPSADRPAAFSFGTPLGAASKTPAAEVTAEAVKAPAEAVKPQAETVKQPVEVPTVAAPPFGVASTPAPFTFGVQPSSGPAASSASVPATTPSVPFSGASGTPAVSFGAASAVAPAPASSIPGFTFGTTSTAPAFGAAAAAPPPAAGAAPTIAAPQFNFGAPVQPQNSSAIAASSFAPAVQVSSAPSSTAAPSFGAAPAAVSAAPGVSFTFGAAASAPAASSAAPASTTPAAPTFGFGSASAATTAQAPLPAFGSPMPTANPSAAPTFGSSQPAGGFGFATASAPASATFTFGAQGSGSSAGGAAPTSSGGFGIQQGSTTPASTFSFGSAAPAPTFGAGTAAPSFGAAAPSQPTFGSSAPAFGAQAAAPANPFGAAAPGFNTPAAQPSFGAPPASSGPVFGNTAPAAAPSFGGFGAPASSNGGAPATGMFGFGAGATPTFGSAQPAAPPMFGQSTPTFGAQVPQPQQAPAPSFGGFGSAAPAPAPGGFGGFGAQAPAFGGVPPSPGVDAGGAAFSLGAGEAKDGRKRIKARRHGGH